MAFASINPLPVSLHLQYDTSSMRLSTPFIDLWKPRSMPALSRYLGLYASQQAGSVRKLCTSRLSPVSDGLFERIAGHPGSRIGVTHNGYSQSYGELRAEICRIADTLRCQKFPHSFDAPARAGILHRPGHSWLHGLLGTFYAGLVAVPLSPLYPPHALQPLLHDAAVSCVLAPPNLGLTVGDFEVLDVANGARCGEHFVERCEEVGHDATRMLLYTSGTTGVPKGVVWTEGMLRYQLDTLTQLWRWRGTDRALCVLPLHHVHGVVNIVLSAMYSGAEVEFHDRFCAERVWDTLCGDRPPSVFMAVPTVYARLIEKYKMADVKMQESMRIAAGKVRLFVAGSAALPRQSFVEWEKICGQRILERYGMTETGMLMSNEYGARYCGTIGKPLPGVRVRVDDGGGLWVKGGSVFAKYWRKEGESEQAFDAEGWFGTGDVVEFDKVRQVYRMVGRASSDIIKSGGYKISALEIESALKDVEDVRDVVVVGVRHLQLGEGVLAIAILKNGTPEEAVREKILSHATQVLPRYKVPRAVHFVKEFPRNEMGKVKKMQVKNDWADWYAERGWKSGAVGG